jgi:hypothetical protein
LLGQEQRTVRPGERQSSTSPESTTKSTRSSSGVDHLLRAAIRQLDQQRPQVLRRLGQSVRRLIQTPIARVQKPARPLGHVGPLQSPRGTPANISEPRCAVL